MGTVWPPPEREAQENKRVWFGLFGNIVGWFLVLVLLGWGLLGGSMVAVGAAIIAGVILITLGDELWSFGLDIWRRMYHKMANREDRA